MKTTYKVFAYKALDTDTLGGEPKWIAAPSAEAADKFAERRGWRPDGEVQLQYIPHDRPGLKQLGCDVIISGASR